MIRYPIWTLAANILNNQSWTADKRWYSNLWLLDEVLIISPPITCNFAKCSDRKPRNWTDDLVRPEAHDRDGWRKLVNTVMKFGSYKLQGIS